MCGSRGILQTLLLGFVVLHAVRQDEAEDADALLTPGLAGAYRPMQRASLTLNTSMVERFAARQPDDSGDPGEDYSSLCTGHHYQKNNQETLSGKPQDPYAKEWTVSHFNDYGALLKSDLVYKNYKGSSDAYTQAYNMEIRALRAARFCNGVIRLHDCSMSMDGNPIDLSPNPECIVCFYNEKAGRWQPTKKTSLIMQHKGKTLINWVYGPQRRTLVTKFSDSLKECMQTWYESLRDSLQCLHAKHFVHGNLKWSTIQVSEGNSDAGFDCPHLHIGDFTNAASVDIKVTLYTSDQYVAKDHLPSSLFKGQKDLLGLRDGKYFKVHSIIDWCSFIQLFEDLAKPLAPLNPNAVSRLIADGVLQEQPACG